MQTHSAGILVAIIQEVFDSVCSKMSLFSIEKRSRRWILCWYGLYSVWEALNNVAWPVIKSRQLWIARITEFDVHHAPYNAAMDRPRRFRCIPVISFLSSFAAQR